MKIAHLDTGREWRGGQSQVALLLRGLAARGVASVLLAPEGPLLERAAALGAATRPWHARGDLDAAAVAAAQAALRRERPDVVHVHTARAHALGVPAARLAGVERVVASRRVAFPPRRDPGSRLKYRLPVDRWLCVSEAARRALIEAGVEDDRTVVVPSGVDLDAVRAAAGRPAEDLRARLGLSQAVLLLATVGSFTAEKNHALLLEVASRLEARAPQAHFVWVGDGPLLEPLRRERDRRGLEGRVHLLGRRDDVPELVQQCALLLVASRHEGLCTAAIEAEALGIPVVATRAGGLPEAVVHGETGVLVPPGDAEAMTEAVAGLLSDPARRGRMGERSRDHAARFSADRMVEGTLAVYQDLVRSKSEAR